MIVRRRMLTLIPRSLLIAVILAVLAAPGHAAGLTQRDWMITLVDALGWGYGLPDEPQDPDYLNILLGNREFRFEAEDIFALGEDNVSLMTFRNFGEFSGRGWLHGTKDPTDIHLKFNLPIGGQYRLDAKLRQEGHLFRVAGETVTIGAGPAFTMINVGVFELKAGAQEIVVTLPPNGSIDSITLAAPNLPIIAPAQGWQPDEAVSWDDINTTLIQLYRLADLFPEGDGSVAVEAEQVPQPGVAVVDTPHLGRPSEGRWLRAGALPADLSFPVRISRDGFYDLSLRVMGSPIRVSVDGHHQVDLDAPPYLDDFTFPSLYFHPGNSSIRILLPPEGGIDRLELVHRPVDAGQASRLFGMPQGAPPAPADFDTLTLLLAAFGVER